MRDGRRVARAEPGRRRRRRRNDFFHAARAAGVVGIGEQTAIRSASPVEQIYYRRYYHRHYYHPYYRRHYYHRRYYGYNPYYYNPAAAVVGTAAAVATIPFWGWGYPY